MSNLRELLDKKLEDLRRLCIENGVTQGQILEEMNEKESKVIENIGGMHYIQAMMNIAGVPVDEDRFESTEHAE